MVVLESSVKYHPLGLCSLTSSAKNDEGQFLVGSFSGALPSQRVTEGPKGSLGANGNRADSVMAKESLTARRTCRADTKVEHSDPTFRIRCGGRSTDKSYPGDNRLVPPKSPYRRRCSAPRCRLNLSWGRGEGPKGLAVRQLKSYASWVQTVHA